MAVIRKLKGENSNDQFGFKIEKHGKVSNHHEKP